MQKFKNLLKGISTKIMRILKNVFVDIPMFLARNTFTGDLSVRKDSLAIKDSIKNIILTLFHERPFDPEFGTNVMSALFENPQDFSFYVENTIATALERYEPRIKLIDIKNTFEGRTLNISIEYRIKDYESNDKISFTLDSTRYTRTISTPNIEIPFDDQFDIVFKYLINRYEPGWSAGDDVVAKQLVQNSLGISGALNPFNVGGSVMSAFQFVAPPSSLGASAGWFDPIINPRQYASVVRSAYRPFERARSPAQANHKFISYNRAGLSCRDIYFDKSGGTNTFFGFAPDFLWYPDRIDTSDAFRQAHSKCLTSNLEQNLNNKIERMYIHSPYGSITTPMPNDAVSGAGKWRNIPWISNRYVTESFKFDQALLLREETTLRDLLTDPSVVRDPSNGIIINGTPDTYLNRAYSGLTFPAGYYSITQGFLRQGGHTLPVTVGTPWISYPNGITWTGGWFGPNPPGLCFDKRTMVLFNGGTFPIQPPTLNHPSTSSANLPAGSQTGLSYAYGQKILDSLDELSADWSDKIEFISYHGLVPYGPLYETEVPWMFFKDPTDPENVRYMKWRLDASVSHWKEKFKSPIDGFAHIMMDASAVIDRTLHQYQAPGFTLWKNITPSGASFVENIPVSWARDQFNFTRGASSDPERGVIYGIESWAQYMFKHDAFTVDPTNTEQSRFAGDPAPRHWCLDDDISATLHTRSYDMFVGQRKHGFTYTSSIWGMGVCGSSELGEIFAVETPDSLQTLDAYPFFFNTFIEFSGGSLKWKRIAGTTFGDGGGVPWVNDRRFRLFYLYPAVLSLNMSIVDQLHDGYGYFAHPFGTPISGWYDKSLGNTFMAAMESSTNPIVSTVPFERRSPTKPPQNFIGDTLETSEFELLYACMKGGITQGLNSLGFNTLFNKLYTTGATGFDS
jgi:phage baseplate assembly protein W